MQTLARALAPRLLLGVAFATAALFAPLAVQAQVSTRAYAPEDLRTLSRNDQSRVISLEYSEQSNGRRIPDDQLRFYLDQVARSNWTFSRIKQDIATSLAAGPRPPVPPPGAGPVVRCESVDNRPRTCPVGWKGPARLSRQLSGARCIEGQSWRSVPGGVWVAAGCRAEFVRANARPPAGNYQVTCSSKDNRMTTCAWDRGRGRPRLLQQLSKSPCVEGRTWGYDRREQLWVAAGCRARFGNR